MIYLKFIIILIIIIILKSVQEGIFMALLDDLSEQLLAHAITPSIQRIQILDYLQGNKTHPTAEQIYADLQKTSFSLSKATVYNTLSLFSAKGLVRVLPMENNENRYDIVSETHGHFICSACKNVYDIAVDIDSCIPDSFSGFEIHEKSMFLKGLCPHCHLKQTKF